MRHTRRCSTSDKAAPTPAPPPASRKQPPRFYTSHLPTVPGAAVALEPDETRHALRVLRLRPGDAVQLCDGSGGLVAAEISYVDKSSATVVATAVPQQVSWSGPRWIVAAACLTLKGGRTDWLVEKATELGAAALLPLITQRSQTGTTKAKFKALKGGSREQQQQQQGAGSDDFQPSRLQRLALAASKQSLRLHGLQLLPARTLPELLPELQSAPLSLVATAGAPPVLQVLEQALQQQQQAAGALSGAVAPAAAEGGPWHGQACYLLVGPEGDFTDSEVQGLAAAGVLPVGLGTHRLRTETAAMAVLAAAALFTDARSR